MRALEGIRVLDLGQIYNGPYCAMLLGYLGAEVIKVEPPSGESTRSRVKGKEAYPFMMLNGNKKDICINLKSDAGKKIFLDLVRKADVVVENYAVGVMDRLGLSYEVLSKANPRIIVASGKGFGSWGPNKDFLAMDLTVQAMTAVMSVTGFEDQPPVKAGVALSDFLGGIHLMSGVLAALYQRERTGRGDFVEVSMQDAVFPTLASNLGGYFETNGTLPERVGNRHGGLAIAPYNVYQAEDGWVSIFCVTDRHWHSLTELMGIPHLATDPRYLTVVDRANRMDEVDGLVEGWTRKQDKQEIVQKLTGAHVPCAPVVSLKELIHDKHIAARHMLPEVQHPTMGSVRIFGNPIHLAHSDEPEFGPSPLLGADTDSVLSSLLEMNDQQLAALRDQGVIA